MSFQRLPILKVNLVEKMKRNTYSDVILLVMHKTLPSFTAFTWFNGKSKMAAKTATLFGDVTGLQQHHHTWNISLLVEKIKGFPLKVKSFQNIATYLARGSINPVPLPRPCSCYKGLACSKEQATYSKKKHFLPVKIPSLIILAPLLILHKLNCKLPHLHTDHSVIEECSKGTRRHLWSLRL